MIAEQAPGPVGFNEFGRLFVADGIRFDGEGLVGSNWTRSLETAASATKENITVSAGQFAFRTDGFRDNADQKIDIYSLFGQMAVTPELSIQAEGRRRTSDEGDIVLNFSPDDFSTAKELSTDENTARLGARYAPSPASTFLGSIFY